MEPQSYIDVAKERQEPEVSGAVLKVAKGAAVGALMCLVAFAVFEVMGDEAGAALVFIALVILGIAYVLVASRGSTGGAVRSEAQVPNDELQLWDWTTFGVVIGALALGAVLSSLFSESWKWLVLGFVATAGGSFADARNRRQRRGSVETDDID